MMAIQNTYPCLCIHSKVFLSEKCIDIVSNKDLSRNRVCSSVLREDDIVVKCFGLLLNDWVVKCFEESAATTKSSIL